MDDEPKVVIVLGCGRSGTTILGEVLERHPDLANWYEPYFIWDWYLGVPPDSTRSADLATDRVKSFIRREFSLFSKKSKKPWVIDKSPEHCFTIPYILAVFPNAKWIHITRDGRDVVLSMNKLWQQREAITQRRSIRGLLAVVWEMLFLHPFWRNRFQAIWYELKTNRSIDPRKYFNKSKWKNDFGFGPRFSGWEEARNKHTVLEFNALQWVESERAIERDIRLIPAENITNVRYEELLDQPINEVNRILDFVELPQHHTEKMIENLWPSNSGAWKNHFDRAELNSIARLITPMLLKMGFELDANWWQHKNDDTTN